LTKKNILAYLLLPFTWIYAFIVFCRNKFFDLGLLKEEEFQIPIISVGNITVGGTGKTPQIEYLVQLLKNDFRIATLSRGYKRMTKGFVLADKFSDVDSIGDEPCQIKRKFPEIEVSVDSDRKNGIREILNLEKDIEAVLMDDAFQHRYVKPGLSILLIDYNRPITKDFLLPSGRLREPASGRKRADIIVISKSPENITPSECRAIASELKLLPRQKLYFTKVVRNELMPVFENSIITDISELIASKPSVLLVVGIANPREPKRLVMNISPNITELTFPDHHDFSDKDISGIIQSFENMNGSEKILITTEKDAVRLQKYSDLPQHLKNRMFYIPIKVEFLNNDAENFNKQIIDYVKKNKRNSILHTGEDKVST
jgi:tetraacyldisaccharide 4'-kinase